MKTILSLLFTFALASCHEVVTLIASSEVAIPTHTSTIVSCETQVVTKTVQQVMTVIPETKTTWVTTVSTHLLEARPTLDVYHLGHNENPKQHKVERRVVVDLLKHNVTVQKSPTPNAAFIHSTSYAVILGMLLAFYVFA